MVRYVSRKGSQTRAARYADASSSANCPIARAIGWKSNCPSIIRANLICYVSWPSGAPVSSNGRNLSASIGIQHPTARNPSPLGQRREKATRCKARVALLLRPDSGPYRPSVSDANTCIPAQAPADVAPRLADRRSGDAVACNPGPKWAASECDLRHHSVRLRKRLGCQCLGRG